MGGVTSTIKQVKDIRFIENTGNFQSFTLQLPTQNVGYRYGILIYGDGYNQNGMAIYGLCIGTVPQNQVHLAPIYVGNQARTIEISISDQTITITANAVIYGGIRIIWLG